MSSCASLTLATIAEGSSTGRVEGFRQEHACKSLETSFVLPTHVPASVHQLTGSQTRPESWTATGKASIAARAPSNSLTEAPPLVLFFPRTIFGGTYNATPCLSRSAGHEESKKHSRQDTCFNGHLLLPTTSEAKWEGNRLLIVIVRN